MGRVFEAHHTIEEEVGQVGQLPIFIGFCGTRSWPTSPSSAALLVIHWENQILLGSSYRFHKTPVGWVESSRPTTRLKKGSWPSWPTSLFHRLFAGLKFGQVGKVDQLRPGRISRRLRQAFEVSSQRTNNPELQTLFEPKGTMRPGRHKHIALSHRVHLYIFFVLSNFRDQFSSLIPGPGIHQEDHENTKE